jgi:hypothetical protein
LRTHASFVARLAPFAGALVDDPHGNMMPDGHKGYSPAAKHLAASLRVISSHLHMRRASIDDARDEVLNAAQHVKPGSVTPEVENLVARLEKVTGAGIAELAKAAEG